MILVDSSVWIDYFRGAITPPTDALDSLLGSDPLAVGDLILVEVLQGLSDERDLSQAPRLFASLIVLDLCGHDLAIEAAKNYRKPRSLGVTVSKTIDTVIAKRCIQDGLTLLHSERDFEPFVMHMGLRSLL